MTQIKIAINGFGRIGRLVARLAIENPAIELVAINDLGDIPTMAHLFKYDTVHKKFNGTIVVRENAIEINNQSVKVFSIKDPSTLPWKELNVDVVVESTGIFLTSEKAGMHITAGAKHVIISAPAKDDIVPTVLMGIEETAIREKAPIISNASCTTNCAIPLIKVLDEICEIDYIYLSTTHAFTGDQNLVDAPHKDMRRARAASYSIIPTTTGATTAILKILPHLKGRIEGKGVRVPVINGSLTDLVTFVKKPASVETINAYFKERANGALKGILEYTEEELVSSDIIGNPHSSIFDANLTSVAGNMVQISAWYDNEFGYSNRMIDAIIRLMQ